uniref:DUF4283 domain-containing protein n=1 Tax=Setaria italica TaxID=4555 RepID=K3XQQ7_SETIT
MTQTTQVQLTKGRFPSIPPSFPPQPQANSCRSHPALPPPPPPDHMANFPGNPMLYVPMGQHVEHGWLCLTHSWRGLLLDASLIPFGHGNSIVQNHDEARNFRACPYIRQCWIMFLAFPLDYQTLDFIEAAVASFGRLLHWFEGPTKSRILIQCLVLTPDRVPCSVVVSQGTTLGNGRSWSVPVLILGGHFPDAFLADEDPVPAGGNSHPGHGGVNIHHNNVATTEEELAPHNQNEMQNNKNGEGWPLNQNAMQNNDNDGDWLAWPPIEEVDNNVVEVPHHLDQPQDSISFDQSGMTAKYLRANGPDIIIKVEDICNYMNESSSSGDSSSALVE